jgi:hypothetical protein
MRSFLSSACLCWLLPMLAAGCAAASDNTTACGDGTTLIGGQCVPTEAVVQCATGTVLQDGQCVPTGAPVQCAAGTVLKDGQCVPADGVGACAEGTVLQDGRCVRVSKLAGFTVTLSPKDCDQLVSGKVPAQLVVTALDDAGATLTDFAGSVTLIGMGGIAVSPATLTGFSSGVATGVVTVSGVSLNAEIFAFEATGTHASGLSAPFVVSAEQVRVVMSGPGGPVRAGADLATEVKLRTNACRDATKFAGPIDFFVGNATGDEHVVPARRNLVGPGPHNLTLRVDGVGKLARDIVVAGSVGNGENGSYHVNVVPTFAFAGIKDVYLIDPTHARVTWDAAAGGSGDVIYRVFLSETPGVPGVQAGSVATTGLVVDLPVGAEDGTAFYFTVRAVDSLDDGYDHNLVQLSARKSGVLYVDAAASDCSAGDGSMTTPFCTIKSAFDATVAGVRTIYVAAAEGNDTYAELPLPIGVAKDNVTLVGGFDPATWTRQVNVRSKLVFPSDSSSPAVDITGAGVRFAGFEIPDTVALSSGDSFIFIESSASGAELNDVVVRGAPGVGIVVAANAVISNSEVWGDSGPESSDNCIDVQSGSLTIASGSLVHYCGDNGVNAAGGASALAIDSSTIEQAMNTCVYSNAGTLSVANSVLSNCGYYGVDARGASATIRNTEIDNASNYCLYFSNAHDIAVSDSILNGCGRFGIGIWSYVNSNDLDTSPKAVRLRNNSVTMTGGQCYPAVYALMEDDSDTRSLAIEATDNTVLAQCGSAMILRASSSAPGSVATPGVTVSASASNNHLSSRNMHPSYSGEGVLQVEADSSFQQAMASATGNWVAQSHYYGDPNSPSPFPNGLRAIAYSANEGANASAVASGNVVDNDGSRLGLEANAKAGGSAGARIEGNTVRNTGDRGIYAYARGYGGSSSTTIANNVVENDYDRPGYNGIIAEGYAEGAALTANIVENHIANTRNAGIDASFYSYNAGGAASAVTIADNNLVGNTRYAGHSSGPAVRANVTATASNMTVDVSRNTASGSWGDGVSLDATGEYGASIVAFANDNLVSTGGQCLAASALDRTWDGTSSDFAMTARGNTCMFGSGGISALVGGYSGEGSTSAHNARLDVIDNAIISEGSPGVAAKIDRAQNEAALTVSGNAFETVASFRGDGPVAVAAAVNNSPALATCEVAQNFILGAPGGIAAEGYGSPHIAMDVHHNVAAIATGEQASGTGIQANVRTLGAADGDLPAGRFSINHNTVVGGSLGINASASEVDGTASASVANNIVQDYVHTAIVHDEGILQTNNLIYASPDDEVLAPDLKGPAVFVNRVSFFTTAGMIDPQHNTFKEAPSDEPIAAGDHVSLAGETVVHVVTNVTDGVITVDGLPLPDYGIDGVGVLVWKPADYKQDLPDYHLAPGSAGLGAASDGTDIGAFGGLQSLP